MNHRWGRRFAASLRVRLSYPPYAIAAGQLTDISISGAFVRSTLALPLLARVRIALASAGEAAPQEIEAHVVRRADGGFGVEWAELAPPEVGVILHTLARQSTRSEPCGQSGPPRGSRSRHAGTHRLAAPCAN